MGGHSGCCYFCGFCCRTARPIEVARSDWGTDTYDAHTNSTYSGPSIFLSIWWPRPAFFSLFSEAGEILGIFVLHVDDVLFTCDESREEVQRFLAHISESIQWGK